MNSTMHLISEAEKVKDLSAWAADLGLSKRVLYTAKYREHLSPAVAGELAERLGLDAKEWIVIAALESERDSACKSRMVRKFLGAAALAGAALAPVGAASAATVFEAPASSAVYYVKSVVRKLRARIAKRKLIDVNVPRMSHA